MADKTFKLKDRVIHLQSKRTGEIIFIYSRPLESNPDISVEVYRMKVDNFPSTIEGYASDFARGL